MKRIISLMLSVLLLGSTAGLVHAEERCEQRPPNICRQLFQVPISEAELNERILYSTGFMETNKYFSEVGGDLNNTGIRFGIIQFTASSGDLQKMLREYMETSEEDFNRIFGEDRSSREALRRALLSQNQRELVQLGKRNTVAGRAYPGQKVLRQPWQTYFEKMGSSRSNQMVQIKHAQNYLNRAILASKEFRLLSSQSLAWMFDFDVHSGALKGSDQRRIADRARAAIRSESLEEEKRRLAQIDTIMRRELSNRFRSVEMSKRLNIILKSTGCFHERFYRSCDFRLSFKKEHGLRVEE